MAERIEWDYELATLSHFRYPRVRAVSLSLPSNPFNSMKRLLHSRDAASKGAALMIVLALVVLVTGLALAYFTRTTTDRQLAQASYNDTSADLLARSALDIVVGDFKQEIISDPRVATRNDIQPQRYGDAGIPNLIRRSYSGDPTGRTSSVPSTSSSANGRAISTTRWNSHYLIPRGNPGDTNVNPSPTPTFIAPDWVLVTAQGLSPSPSPNAVIGRYAFAVYDEGGLLDMSVAGGPIDHPNDSTNRSWPSLAGCSSPSPTPWLVNVGRKGILGFADLSALPASGSTNLPQFQVDNIVGWRNYAMTQRIGANFGREGTNPTYAGAGVGDCPKQDWFGSYLLYFGDPPFSIDSLSDKLLASQYPFTSVANYAYPTPAPGVTPRTDQAITTRQQLLNLRSSLNFSQNVLQYMGTFSRERNRPAPDWPNLQNNLSEGRFNLNNFAIVVPNPDDCQIAHGKKKGWLTGKNKNHLCGTPIEVVDLFGLFWVRADTLDPSLNTPGHWKYVGRIRPLPPANGNPSPHQGIACFRGANQQNDFFQILTFALTGSNCAPVAILDKVFGVGASLIDQYDSGDACTGPNSSNWDVGCDMDGRIPQSNRASRTHTTVIEYGKPGSGASFFAYGLEPNFADDSTNGDAPCGSGSQNPHRPSPAPNPIGSGLNKTVFMNHAFSNVGELGYGVDTSALPTPGPSPSPSCAPGAGTTPQPTLNFSSPNFPDAPVLDFFTYNPVSSAYPRAGIVNLYTKNAPVLAAMLAGTLKNDIGASPTPNPLPIISGSPAANSESKQLADAIVAETQGVLAGSPPSGWPVTQTDMTRAIAARLAARATNVVWGVNTADEIKKSIARSLAEMGQTRTWNLMIDVIAQTGQYAPDATLVTQANKFIVQGEKRYWLHIALGRDLVHTDGTPCLPGDTGCQVDVLGTQLEEVVE
jgi:hypothetical protein